MANAKIIEQKKEVVSEIKNKFENAKGVVLFDYRGLSVLEVTELRRKLREAGSDYKVYKNTLTKRALDELKINLDDYLNGPNAIAFSEDSLAPVKILSDFAKNHEKLELRVGVIDGNISGIDVLRELANIPSRETLLTMIASGMLGTIRDLAICVDLYAKKLEENN